PPSPTPAKASRAWPLAAGALALLAAGAGFAGGRAAQPPPTSPIHLRVDMDQDVYVRAQKPVKISPHGARLLFTVMPKPGQYVLATRLLSENKVTILPGTENAAQYFFLPDSQTVGFVRSRQLHLIAIAGGAISQMLPNAPSLWCDF